MWDHGEAEVSERGVTFPYGLNPGLEGIASETNAAPLQYHCIKGLEDHDEEGMQESERQKPQKENQRQPGKAQDPTRMPTDKLSAECESEYAPDDLLAWS